MKVATPFKRTFSTKDNEMKSQEKDISTISHWLNQKEAHTCKGVSSPVSSDILAINKPHSVLIPTAVTWTSLINSYMHTRANFMQ